MNPEEEYVSLYIRVRGRVQGVGFRSFVAQQAALLGVSGWVRNLERNQVETRAEGTRETLEAFFEKVKAGPNVARVDDVEFVWGEFLGEYKTFSVRWF